MGFNGNSIEYYCIFVYIYSGVIYVLLLLIIPDGWYIPDDWLILIDIIDIGYNVGKKN